MSFAKDLARVLGGKVYRGTLSTGTVPAGERGFVRYTNPAASGKRLIILELEGALQAAGLLNVGMSDVLAAMTAITTGVRCDDLSVSDGVVSIDRHNELVASSGPWKPLYFFRVLNVAADSNEFMNLHNAPIVLLPGQGIIFYTDLTATQVVTHALWIEIPA